MKITKMNNPKKITEASGFREYLGSAEKCLSNYNTENYVGTFHSQCKLFE